MKENLSELVHVIPAAKTVSSVEFLLPQQGTVVGDSPAGFYVDIKGERFFCPYDRAGALAIGNTAFFCSIHYKQGLHVSHPQGVATIIQVAYSEKIAREMAFNELFDCAREKVIFYPRVQSVLRWAMTGNELGVKVTFSRGSVRDIAGLITTSQVRPGTHLEDLLGKKVPAEIVSICPPDDK